MSFIFISRVLFVIIGFWNCILFILVKKNDFFEFLIFGCSIIMFVVCVIVYIYKNSKVDIFFNLYRSKWCFYVMCSVYKKIENLVYDFKYNGGENVINKIVMLL